MYMWVGSHLIFDSQGSILLAVGQRGVAVLSTSTAAHLTTSSTRIPLLPTWRVGDHQIPWHLGLPSGDHCPHPSTLGFTTPPAPECGTGVEWEGDHPGKTRGAEAECRSLSYLKPMAVHISWLLSENKSRDLACCPSTLGFTTPPGLARVPECGTGVEWEGDPPGLTSGAEAGCRFLFNLKSMFHSFLV